MHPWGGGGVFLLERKLKAGEATLAHADTSFLQDSSRLRAPAVNLQLLIGCYKLMVTFQMSKAHTDDYTDK